ncbi:MAG: hypothetical protein RM347_029460 [Nostoc sp. ChiQUE02]|uniref:hypothetical protein n=1 Tax=Nostoc sp. ChiQUE02 TaxID=3075377 RepID=UPI002AD45F50|nr:hypothetical protein [Nostoc sp. ChiQUE02]MDZ8232699.1 hypothetical protein [Nostoc sp. ChiQUE02]
MITNEIAKATTLFYEGNRCLSFSQNKYFDSSHRYKKHRLSFRHAAAIATLVDSLTLRYRFHKKPCENRSH